MVAKVDILKNVLLRANLWVRRRADAQSDEAHWQFLLGASDLNQVRIQVPQPNSFRSFPHDLGMPFGRMRRFCAAMRKGALGAP